jgi:hypothetical protein
MSGDLLRRYYVALAAVAVVAGVLLAPAGASATVPAASPGVRAVGAGGGWGTAEEVPGLAALSGGHGAELRALSCGAAGSCAAGGAILHGRSEVEAWVAGESNGTWRAAEQVPGLAALNAGRGADIYSLSCGAAGTCAAGGFYHDASGHAQAFVVDETSGTWGTAQRVPGLAALNTGGSAGVGSVSCPSAGSCAAAGDYTVRSGHQQVFVVRETNGTWGAAEPVRGLPVQARGAELQVSCGAAGDCAAGGFYNNSSNDAQAFVVNQTSGTWGTAEQVPGLAALNNGGNAAVTSLSCASAASCTAVGSYSTGRNRRQAFAVDETSGTWGTAQQVPGLAALSKGNYAELDYVSCASAGNCAAGGFYDHYPHRSARTEVFVANEANGTWGTAEQVPGITALSNGGQGDTLTYSVSCGAAGSCSDVGYYQDSASTVQAFAAGQSNGTWHTAQQIPGTAALNQGGTAVAWSVSCATAGSCAAGGDYTDASGREQAFVITKT